MLLLSPQRGIYCLGVGPVMMVMDCGEGQSEPAPKFADNLLVDPG
jgi:hypothetical protein